MTYEVAIDDFILMETDDKVEAIKTMYEVIDGEASMCALAWVNVFDDDGEYVETIEDNRANKNGKYMVEHSTEQCVHIYTWYFDTFEEALALTMKLWEKIEPTYEAWMDCLVIEDTSETNADGWPRKWWTIEDLLDKRWTIEDLLDDEENTVDDGEHWYVLQDIVQYF